MMQNTDESSRKNLKYRELYDALCGQIPDLLKKGTVFFTQMQIQDRYGVSRQTVLRALRQMEADGLIVSRRGSGTPLTGLLPETEKNQVVLLLSSDSSYTYPSLINDVSSVLRAARYSISICASHGSLREEREILTRLCADPPRGLLLECCHSALPTPNADLIGALSARKTAVAVIGGVCPNLAGLVSVREDDRSAGQALCRHFLRCGHRQLGGIFLSDTSRGQERYFGFVCALKEAGYLPLPEDILWLTRDIFTDIEEKEPRHLLAVLQHFLMRRAHSLTGILCQNDLIAWYLGRACRAAGIRVPEDLSIGGFDGSYLSQAGGVSLVSMAHEKHEPGQSAARTLIRAMSGQYSPPDSVPWILRPGKSIRAI